MVAQFLTGSGKLVFTPANSDNPQHVAFSHYVAVSILAFAFLLPVNLDSKQQVGVRGIVFSNAIDDEHWGLNPECFGWESP